MSKSLANVPYLTRKKNPHLALGVRPFVNCASLRTAQSASLMRREMRGAIAETSCQFVGLDELMKGRMPPDSGSAPMSLLPVETFPRIGRQHLLLSDGAQ